MCVWYARAHRLNSALFQCLKFKSLSSFLLYARRVTAYVCAIQSQGHTRRARLILSSRKTEHKKRQWPDFVYKQRVLIKTFQSLNSVYVLCNDIKSVALEWPFFIDAELKEKCWVQRHFYREMNYESINFSEWRFSKYHYSFYLSLYHN